MDKFWPEPNWHAHGLPTRDELRASNKRRSAELEVTWDSIPLPSPLTPEAIEHITNGTIPVRYLSLDEIREKYGPA